MTRVRRQHTRADSARERSVVPPKPPKPNEPAENSDAFESPPPGSAKPEFFPPALHPNAPGAASNARVLEKLFLVGEPSEQGQRAQFIKALAGVLPEACALGSSLSRFGGTNARAVSKGVSKAGPLASPRPATLEGEFQWKSELDMEAFFPIGCIDELRRSNNVRDDSKGYLLGQSHPHTSTHP